MSHITDAFREIVAKIDDDLVTKVYAAIAVRTRRGLRIHLAEIPACIGLMGATKTRERKVTKSIEILRKAGVTIVANNKGYKLSAVPEEIREQARVYRAKATSATATAQSMEIAADAIEKARRGFETVEQIIQSKHNLKQEAT